MIFLHFSLFFITFFLKSRALLCPENGNWNLNRFKNQYTIWNKTVNERNVTDLIDTKRFSPWNRPVLFYNQPIHVTVKIYLLRIIKVVNYYSITKTIRYWTIVFQDDTDEMVSIMTDFLVVIYRLKQKWLNFIHKSHRVGTIHISYGTKLNPSTAFHMS